VSIKTCHVHEIVRFYIHVSFEHLAKVINYDYNMFLGFMSFHLTLWAQKESCDCLILHIRMKWKDSLHTFVVKWKQSNDHLILFTLKQRELGLTTWFNLHVFVKWRQLGKCPILFTFVMKWRKWIKLKF